MSALTFVPLVMADEEQGVTEDDEKVTEDRATMTPKLRGRLLECTSCGLMPASREKRGCCHHLVAGTDGDVSEVVTWVWNSELPQFAAMPKITLGPDVDTSGTTDYKCKSLHTWAMIYRRSLPPAPIHYHPLDRTAQHSGCRSLPATPHALAASRLGMCATSPSFSPSRS